MEKIAVTSQSRGGIEALVADADPRVGSVASLNSGFFELASLGYDSEEFDEVHASVLFVHGDTEAVEYQNAVENYELFAGSAAPVGATGPGHAGLYYELRDDTRVFTVGVLREGVDVLTERLNDTLNAETDAGQYFMSDQGLVALPGRTAESKGL